MARLAQLKVERASQSSYLSYLGLDLLGWLAKFFREDRVAFANQELSQEPTTWRQHLHHLYYRDHQFDFCLRDNTVLQRQRSEGVQLNNFEWKTETTVRLNGHRATYFHQEAVWTFDFLTQTFTSTPCPLEEIIDATSTYSGFDVRKGRLLVTRTTATGQKSLCLVYPDRTWQTIQDDLGLYHGYIQSGSYVFLHWSDCTHDTYKYMAVYSPDTRQRRPIVLPPELIFSPHKKMSPGYLSPLGI